MAKAHSGPLRQTAGAQHGSVTGHFSVIAKEPQAQRQGGQTGQRIDSALTLPGQAHRCRTQRPGREQGQKQPHAQGWRGKVQYMVGKVVRAPRFLV